MTTMIEEFTIGQLAERGGVPDSTVRFYERKGLLMPSGRTEANYRVYGPESVERLRFIRAAQASGFSLEDIHMLLEFRDGVVAPCSEVATIIQSRLEQVGRQIEDLRAIQRTLRNFKEACSSTGAESECPVLDEFADDRNQRKSRSRKSTTTNSKRGSS